MGDDELVATARAAYQEALPWIAVPWDAYLPRLLGLAAAGLALKAEQDILPHYAVERGLFNAATDRPTPGECPVCGKSGRWAGERFVPANERQARYPRCYCRTIHEAGGSAYDPATKSVLGGKEEATP